MASINSYTHQTIPTWVSPIMNMSLRIDAINVAADGYEYRGGCGTNCSGKRVLQVITGPSKNRRILSSMDCDGQLMASVFVDRIPLGVTVEPVNSRASGAVGEARQAFRNTPCCNARRQRKCLDGERYDTVPDLLTCSTAVLTVTHSDCGTASVLRFNIDP